MRRSKAHRKQTAYLPSGKQKSHAEKDPSAESIAHAKSAFIANISHEIRTPMNAIIGFAQMLKNSGLNAQQADYVEVIIDSGKKLLLIISNLLDLSNLQLGKTTLNPRPGNLNELTDRLWQRFRPLILAKNLSPILECATDFPEFIADSEKIERVAGYIISNAIKFTPSGFVAFRSSSKPLSGNQMLLCLEVADSGIGIEPDRLSTIFDVFEQGDNSITRPFGGMGIGLGLSRQIVELMKGTIKVHSTPGEGSRFIIEIPVQLCNPETS